MMNSTDYLEWQSELNHANRAFAAMMGGQQYGDITREEAERLAGRQGTSPVPGRGAGTPPGKASLTPISVGD